MEYRAYDVTAPRLRTWHDKVPKGREQKCSCTDRGGRDGLLKCVGNSYHVVASCTLLNPHSV